MGLFSQQKTCRRKSDCNCGGSKKQDIAAPPGYKSDIGEPIAPSGGTHVGGGHKTHKSAQPEVDTSHKKVDPLSIDDYVKYLQRTGKMTTSPVVLRGLVSNHLQKHPGISLVDMLRRVKRQV